jgi:hypothetical protein
MIIEILELKFSYMRVNPSIQFSKTNSLKVTVRTLEIDLKRSVEGELKRLAWARPARRDVRLAAEHGLPP